MTTQVVDKTNQASVALSEDASRTAMMTLAAVLGAMVLVLVIGMLAIRSWLVAPIKALAVVMGKLANGDLGQMVDGTGRKDEIGTMAKAVQVFKDNGLRTRELEAEAERNRSMSEVERQRQAEIERERAEAMAEATNGLAGGLQRLSQGDLGVRLETAFAQDFESLRADFNAAVGQLAETLRAVLDATGSIDNGSREISQAATDLSKRTEQQAAALEETAAALDQITANVSNSANRTEEARQIAAKANQSARHSADVITGAVQAMLSIEQSSTQISSIIGVIDEIAFQTNLLALNAGVEAARAGEAGKGFAVVAQEVRELAQRSAQAAKEIKELIRKSADEVATGVRRVKETGEVLKVIEDQVVTINTQLDAIATSAREQTVGLSEVNTAVNQMDQVTQQNAAMVEQSTAASATLASEASRLTAMVSQFDLGDGGRASRHATPHSAPHPASQRHQPVASPAKSMMARVARAVGMGNGSAAAREADWTEF